MGGLQPQVSCTQNEHQCRVTLVQLSAQQRAAILGEELLKKATQPDLPPVPVVPVQPVDLVAEATKPGVYQPFGSDVAKRVCRAASMQ